MPGSPSLFPVDHYLAYHDEQMALREAAYDSRVTFGNARPPGSRR
jgi:hypothetical protein